jgi:hypothetical protein
MSSASDKVALPTTNESRPRPRSRPLYVLIGLAVIAGMVGVLFGHNSVRWTGFAYPDRSNLTVHFQIGEFETLDECRNSARQKLRDMQAEQCQGNTIHPLVNSAGKSCDQDPLIAGGYECGKNCKSRGLGLKVCEETVR